MTSTGSSAIDALRTQLGAAAVLTGEDIPERNTNDWSPQSPTRPLAVVRPADPAEVAAAMRICHEHALPVVPQGGLTGLCGGARPVAGAIALSLERLVGIEEIDPASCTMTVLAGTPLELVQRAADEAGFFFPLDLGARGSCAIGGNLSTNAGGNRVIRYGMAREMTLGIEVVLPDGTLVTGLNKMLKNNAGYDLKHLFIGSEGTLGIITRVVLRVHPKPACTMVAMCALNDYAGVLELLAAARRDIGPLLSAFEVMWPDYWDVATRQVPGVRDPFEADAARYGAYVLIEALGTDPALDVPRFEAGSSASSTPATFRTPWSRNRCRMPARCGACAMRAPNSSGPSARTCRSTSACRPPTWTPTHGAAATSSRRAFRVAAACTTATSATATCT
jgi:FAD/FMN-containing dehydrogenase